MSDNFEKDLEDSLLLTNELVKEYPNFRYKNGTTMTMVDKLALLRLTCLSFSMYSILGMVDRKLFNPDDIVAVHTIGWAYHENNRKHRTPNSSFSTVVELDGRKGVVFYESTMGDRVFIEMDNYKINEGWLYPDLFLTMTRLNMFATKVKNILLTRSNRCLWQINDLADNKEIAGKIFNIPYLCNKNV